MCLGRCAIPPRALTLPDSGSPDAVGGPRVTSTRSARSAGELMAVPVCSIGANALAYLLLLAGAHTLHRGTYGELVALLGVLLVGTVPSLALQMVTARRVATGSDLRGLPTATLVLGAGAGALLIVLSPPLA